MYNEKNSSMKSRKAAVTGIFYPYESSELKDQILSLLAQAKTEFLTAEITVEEQHCLRAIIVPHAGYIYSGLSAAYAYNTLIQGESDQNTTIKRVILLGPTHHVAFDGMAVPGTLSFSTPLGNVLLDRDEINTLVQGNLVISSNLAHEQEHSLEVQLPFLQTIIKQFELIPIVVGQCSIESVAKLLSRYINNPYDLIVISTDLSHFLEYSEAVRHDKNTSDKIMAFNYDQFESNDACGRVPMAGMLKIAKLSGLSIEQLDLRNSGDTAGDKQRVVGYGSWSLYAE